MVLSIKVPERVLISCLPWGESEVESVLFIENLIDLLGVRKSSIGTNGWALIPNHGTKKMRGRATSGFSRRIWSG